MFPLHDLSYARGLPHIGEVLAADGLSFPVLRRPIPGTPWFDGILPPPYVAPLPAEVTELARSLPHLVSIVGSIRPESGHCWSEVANVAVAKSHWVLHPDRPLDLSPRTHRQVASGGSWWRFEVSGGTQVAGETAAMHVRVADTRGFAESAYPAVHFDQLARAPWGVFFTAVGPQGELGAMACGALWNDEVHLLHMAVSADGLRSSASYVLMAGTTGWCIDRGLTMFFGSLPRSDPPGLARFKARWTNSVVPSHLIRVVVRPAEYRSLVGALAPSDDFFPAYRAG